MVKVVGDFLINRPITAYILNKYYSYLLLKRIDCFSCLWHINTKDDTA